MWITKAEVCYISWWKSHTVMYNITDLSIGYKILLFILHRQRLFLCMSCILAMFGDTPAFSGLLMEIEYVYECRSHACCV